MSKVAKKTAFWKGFWIAAAISVVVAALALTWFWMFIAAYENSRPQVTVDAYLKTATAENIAAADSAIPQNCDLDLQNEEIARKIIAENVGTVTCLRDTKRSSDERLVYAVMNGNKRIGSLTMTVVEKDQFGFECWQITEETYDFSHLMGETVSVTVPEGYKVFADGVLLGERYVTERGVHFENLEPYYKNYDAPTLLTYTVGNVLGTPTLSVADQNGGAVDIQSDSTIQASFSNCTEAETESLKTFVEGFVKAYVRYSSGGGGSGMRYQNYYMLDKYMVPGGELEERMKSALASLFFVVDHRAEVKEICYNQFICVDEGAYMCDLTYTVSQNAVSGRTESNVSLRILVVETENGLRAEAMSVY